MGGGGGEGERKLEARSTLWVDERWVVGWGGWIVTASWASGSKIAWVRGGTVHKHFSTFFTSNYLYHEHFI